MNCWKGFVELLLSRIFKANGLSMSVQPRIEGEDLSIPASLNATFFTRSKYLHTSDASAPRSGTIAGADLAASCGVAVGNLCQINTNAWFIDAQAQGMISGRELGVYFMYAEGDDPDPGLAGEFNMFGGMAAPGGDKPSGWGLDAEYSMTPNLHLLGSFSQSDNGAAGDKQMMGLGLYWKIAQNITMQPMYELFSGDQGLDSNGDDVTRLSVTLEADF